MLIVESTVSTSAVEVSVVERVAIRSDVSVVRNSTAVVVEGIAAVDNCISD